MTAEKKRYPTGKQLAAELSAGKIHPSYLFIGEEEGEKEKTIARIISLVLGGTGESTAAGRYHMEMDEFMRAAEFALLQSMFSEKKVCVMLNIQALQAGGQTAPVLDEIITARPGGVTLIMTTPENRPPRALGAALLEHVRVYHFWRLFEKDMLAYLGGRLADRGLKMDREAAELLIARTGRDVRKLDDALELIGNSLPGGTVNSAAVRAVIEDESDATMYEFADAVFMRDHKAFHLLKKLIENNQPELVLLGQLFRQAEQIETYHALVRGGTPPDEAIRKAGVRPRGVDAFIGQARANSPSVLETIFPLLSSADYRIKSARRSKSLESRPLFDALVELFANGRMRHP